MNDQGLPHPAINTRAQFFKASLASFYKRNSKQKKCSYSWYQQRIMDFDAEEGRFLFTVDENTTYSDFKIFSEGTDTNAVVSSLKKDWNLFEPKPDLILSIVGTTEDSYLSDRLIDELFMISNAVSLIILTSGVEHDLIAKKLGDALETNQRYTDDGKPKVRCVGITSWSWLKDKLRPMMGKKCTFRFKRNGSVNNVLSPGHSHFLLVDNGTEKDLTLNYWMFWAKLARSLKGECRNVVSLILGGKRQTVRHVEMTRELLQFDLPVIFLQGNKSLDVLISGVRELEHEDTLDASSMDRLLYGVMEKDKDLAEAMRKFLDDAESKYKSLVTVCSLLYKYAEAVETGHNFGSTILKALVKPLLEKAGRSIDDQIREAVLDILQFATKSRIWDISIQQLLTYDYKWNRKEKGQLKTTFENCLKADQAEIFTVCERLIPMNEFLTQRQLQDLYIETEYSAGRKSKDCLERTGCCRWRVPSTCSVRTRSHRRPQKTAVYNLNLPDFFCSTDIENSGDQLERYKALLLWAVLSRKWKLVDWILYRKQKDDILCWFLSTAFICKAAKKWEKDTQIMKEYRAKQENFENIGIKMLEKISSQHKDDVRNVLDGKSKLWGDLCPAELAFFANFKTFVKSEAFHRYIVQRWVSEEPTIQPKSKQNTCECCDSFCISPRVKFYTHWASYMVMVLVFSAAIVSRIQESHFIHQLWLIMWVLSYEIGEFYSWSKEHKKVKFISFRKRLSLAARKYLVLILLAIFLFAGFVSTYFGILHWGGISYGVACMLLVQNVSHYMTALRLYAPQLYIFEKALKEILTFLTLIILLLWSVSMIFHGILCLDTYSSEETSEEKSVMKPGGWVNLLHTIWYLYLSLYGEYSFELNETGNLSCIADQRVLMWILYVLLGVHIIVGHVLVMNLFISVISTKADNMARDLDYVFKCNWLKLTFHYEKQTILPPPFNLIELVYRKLCSCVHKCNCCTSKRRDLGSNGNSETALESLCNGEDNNYDEPDACYDVNTNTTGRRKKRRNTDIYQKEAFQSVLVDLTRNVGKEFIPR